MEALNEIKTWLKKPIQSLSTRISSPQSNGKQVLFKGANQQTKLAAAQKLAQEAGKELYRIDLLKVVSKYIGETEKNLNAVFEKAQKSGAVLFFDEADALFGKRTTVKDSNDKYANQEVSYLLQRMEDYKGLTILSLKTNVDSAFLRRMRFVVEFE